MKDILAQVFEGHNLSQDDALRAMDLIMSGSLAPEVIGGFLGALRAKGETIDEITGFAKSMRKHALVLPIKRLDLIDTCGTGGSGIHSFNISTISGLILAAAGCGVVKHGNRSISSKCGSADLLEAWGVRLDLTPEQTAACVDELGFGFLFARTLHPAMKHVASIRVQLAVRTVFNLLGPLTNPAGAHRQVLGIFDGTRLTDLAQVLCELDVEEAMVVHGDDEMDEVTLTTKTQVAHLKKGKVESYELTPDDFGLPYCSVAELQGGDTAKNLEIADQLIEGKLRGPKRNIVLANASCALWVAGKAGDLKEGCRLAGELIDSGAVVAVLQKLRKFR